MGTASQGRDGQGLNSSKFMAEIRVLPESQIRCMGRFRFLKRVIDMKVGELIDYLQLFNDEEELEIDIYETISKKYIDTTADVVIEDDSISPTLRIDIEAGKFITN